MKRLPSATILVATLVAILVFPLLSFPSAALAEIAGKVTRLRGDVVASIGTQERRLALGDAVAEGETLTTGADTRLELTLADDTVVTLGDHSELLIDTYIFSDEKQLGLGLLVLSRGVFRAVSGKLAGLSGAPLQVMTPIATIGIRGTDFWGEQKTDNLVVALLGGKGVFVQNQAGRVDITEALFATQVTLATRAPSKPFKLTEEQLNAAVKTVSW